MRRYEFAVTLFGVHAQVSYLTIVSVLTHVRDVTVLSTVDMKNVSVA